MASIQSIYDRILELEERQRILESQIVSVSDPSHEELLTAIALREDFIRRMEEEVMVRADLIRRMHAEIAEAETETCSSEDGTDSDGASASDESIETVRCENDAYVEWLCFCCNECPTYTELDE